MKRKTKHDPGLRVQQTESKTPAASAPVADESAHAAPGQGVLGLQRLIGNRATQQMLTRPAVQRKGPPAPAQEATPPMQSVQEPGEGEQEQFELETETQTNTPNMSSTPADDVNQPTPQDTPEQSGNEANVTPVQPELASEPQNSQADEKEDTPAQPQDEVYGPPLPEGGLPTDPQEVLENLPEDELKNASEDLPEISSEPQETPADEPNSSQMSEEPASDEPQDGPLNVGNEGEPVNGGENPAPANTNQPPAPVENGNGGAGGAPPANVGGTGGTGGTNGLLDKELAENKRAGATQPQDPKAAAKSLAGDTWSLDRLGFVAENAFAGAVEGTKTGAAMGVATGVGTRMAERGALYATQKWGPKILSNVAKATPIPAVGAVIGGGLAAYALYNKWNDRENIYKSITAFGTGEDGFEVMANSLDSISQIIDIVSAGLNVIAGIAGLFAIGAWVAAVLSAGALTPLAGAATALAAGIGVATTVLDLVNLGIGGLILAFRSLHMMNKDFEGPEAALKAGQDLQKAAAGPFSSAGAFAGGKAAGRGKKSQAEFDSKVAQAPLSGGPAPASQGPQIALNVPTSNTPPADANATAPSALPVNVPTPASQPDVPTPASQPDVPTPASQPDVPTPASQPDVPTPASQPDIPTSQQTGVQNPDGGGIFTGAQNSHNRNDAREDFKQITEQDIDAMLNQSLNPDNPQISVVGRPDQTGNKKPDYTDKDVDAMLNNAFDPTHPDSILVGDSNTPASSSSTGDQNPASNTQTPDQNPASNTQSPDQGPVSNTQMPEQGPVSNTQMPDQGPASNTQTPDQGPASNTQMPAPTTGKKPWFMTPERIAAHEQTHQKWKSREERLKAAVGKGKDFKMPMLGWFVRSISETSVDGAPAGFGANTPAGQHAGFNLDDKFAEEAAEQEKKSVTLPVEPGYTPPPATPQEVQTLNQEAAALGEEKQAALKAERHATEQINVAKTNEGPLKEAIKSSNEGLESTNEHSQEVLEGAQKNEEKGAKLEEADTEISGSEDAFEQLQPFINLIRGFLRYTYLASYLPDGAESTVNSAADDARGMVENIESARAKVNETKAGGPGQKAKIESDASTLTDVSSQNTDTSKQFEEAKAQYEQSQTENEQMLSNAQQSKENASTQREQISEQKNSTENEAVEMQSSIDQWAAEQAAIRAQALQNASIQAQTQGFEVTAVQDIP